MKKLSRYLLFAFCCFSLQTIVAQDTLMVIKKRGGIIPDFVNLQFAGNIGSGSIGAGYYLNPARNLFLTGIYGYSPAFRTGRAIHNIVLRLTFKPYTYNLPPRQYSLKPLISIAISKQIADSDRTLAACQKTILKAIMHPMLLGYILIWALL